MSLLPKNALAVPEEVIENHGKPASAVADCGSQLCANASEAKKKKKGINL